MLENLEMKLKYFIFTIHFSRLIYGDYILTILHTNDVHARFVSFNERQLPCTNEDLSSKKCWGGVARRQTAMKKFLENDKNVLKLDAGDQFQGTVWYTALKWQPIAACMNIMKYDAMAFGNHEFDDGSDVLSNFVRNLSTPIVNSNIDDGGSSIRDLYERVILKEIGGQRIGIVGTTTTDTPTISHPGPFLEFRDEIRALKPIVENLVTQGVNKIIVLSHSGISIDREICKHLKHVDIVVGGHSHTFLWPTDTPAPSIEVPEGPYPTVVKNGNHTCLVVQAFAYGKYLGRLKAIFDDNGQLKNWTGTPVPLDASTFKEDEEIASILKPYEKELEHFQKTAVATTAVTLDNLQRYCRKQECALGNVMTDAAVWYYTREALGSRSQLHNRSNHSTGLGWTLASIGIMNSGNVRDFTVSAGDNITLADIYQIMPFQNTLHKIRIKGRTLRKAFEHAVTGWNPNEPLGRFLQVSGVRLIYNLSKPEWQRVQNVYVRCGDCQTPKYELMNDESIYNVVTSSFITSGGDGFNMLRDEQLSNDHSNVVDTDTALDYLKTFQPIITGQEMRIVIEN